MPPKTQTKPLKDVPQVSEAIKAAEQATANVLPKISPAIQRLQAAYTEQTAPTTARTTAAAPTPTELRRKGGVSLMEKYVIRRFPEWEKTGTTLEDRRAEIYHHMKKGKGISPNAANLIIKHTLEDSPAAHKELQTVLKKHLDKNPATTNKHVRTFIEGYIEPSEGSKARYAEVAKNAPPLEEQVGDPIAAAEAEKEKGTQVAQMEILNVSIEKYATALNLKLIELKTQKKFSKEETNAGIFGFARGGLKLPGYNFCGPGTDIVGNALSGAHPVNELDAICRDHDYDYTRASTIQDDAERAKVVRDADENMLSKITQIIKQGYTTISDASGAKPRKVLLRERMDNGSAEEHRAVLDIQFAEKVIRLKLKGEDVGLLSPTAFAAYNGKPMNKAELDAAAEEARVLADEVSKLEQIRDAEKLGQPYSPKAVEAEAAKGNDIVDKQLNDMEMMDEEEGQFVDDDDATASMGTQTMPRQTAVERAAERRRIRTKPLPDLGAIPLPPPPGKAPEKPYIYEPVSETTPIPIDNFIPTLQMPYVQASNALEKSAEQKAEEKAAALNPVPGSAISGERNMRPLLEKGGPEDVELKREQIKDNIRWYENFSFVERPNANIQRLPWDLARDYSVNNRLVEANDYNEKVLRFGGALYMPAELPPKKHPMTARTRALQAVPMIRDTQLRQEMQSIYGPKDETIGAPIQFAREPNVFVHPLQNKYSKVTRLYNPQIVDGRRV